MSWAGRLVTRGALSEALKAEQASADGAIRGMRLDFAVGFAAGTACETATGANTPTAARAYTFVFRTQPFPTNRTGRRASSAYRLTADVTADRLGSSNPIPASRALNSAFFAQIAFRERGPVQVVLTDVLATFVAFSKFSKMVSQRRAADRTHGGAIRTQWLVTACTMERAIRADTAMADRTCRDTLFARVLLALLALDKMLKTNILFAQSARL
jgi:hypothetical protein